jgi:tyrosyl-tRNA synthetase
MDLYGELEWRGLVYEATEGFRDLVSREMVTAYAGFDPTASSLHLGHLLPLMALARLQRLGHRPIAVVGGGTGLIGDPSGKSSERTLLSVEQVEGNVARIKVQLTRLLDFDAASNGARLVNNAEWLTRISAMEFLRDVGKHFTVNYMLAKESVKRRIGNEDGDWGQRPVGQHHGRVRPDSSASQRPCVRPGASARHDGGGHEVRENRGRHRVARSGDDDAL